VLRELGHVLDETSSRTFGREGARQDAAEATLDRARLAHEEYVVRIRNDAGAPDTEVRAFHGQLVPGTGIDGSPRRIRFLVPRLAITGARFDFLLSLDVDPRAFPSEEWQSASPP
jgi:hypothetical protein